MKPVIGPLLGLLKSRKFIVGLSGVVVDIIIAFLPQFEAVRGEMLAVVTFVVSVLIASIAYEDAHKTLG